MARKKKKPNIYGGYDISAYGIKKKAEEKKRRVGLPTDLNKQPTRSIDPKTGRYKMDKQYGKGRDSDQPRKPKAESAAEKKANDKLYKRMQDSRDRDRALYGLPPRPLPFSPGYKKKKAK